MSAPISLPVSPSGATVSVHAIHAGHFTAPAVLLFAPVLPGHELYRAPIWAFLVEHHATGKKLMFDLGTRKDMENIPPAFGKLTKTVTDMPGGEYEMVVAKDVATQLKEGGVALDDVGAVIWSHYHVDHVGDVSTFPYGTDLVIHEDTDTRTFPKYEDSMLTKSYFENRNVVKLSFTNPAITIAGLDALDYFGDGSFYILNTPGHCAGHVSALARVTPSTFIMLGGDCCHHVGDIRPTPHHHALCPCPAHVAQLANAAVSKEHYPSFKLETRTEPMLEPNRTMYEDYDTAKATMAKLAMLDAHPDVLTLLAHDATAEGLIEVFPASLDQWKMEGLKEKMLWAFIQADSPEFIFSAK